jgi:hypothetical protein
MKAELETTLTRVAEDVFASMAFIMLLDEESSAPDEVGSRVLAQVQFSGPFDGRLMISVSCGMLPILAANMLGLADGTSTSCEQQHDALKELLNVICGNLLPLIATPRDVFHVHEPHILREDESPDALGSNVSETGVTLWLDCGRVELTLFVNRSSEVLTA